MLPPGDVALSEHVTWFGYMVPPWYVALLWHVAWLGAHATVGEHSDVWARRVVRGAWHRGRVFRCGGTLQRAPTG